MDYEERKYTKIIKKSEEYLRKYPDEMSFYILISLAYSAKKKFNDALKILKRAEERFHSHFELFYQIAAVYSDLDNAEEAEKYYRKSIEATPPEFESSKADCWNDIGALKSNQGLEDEAKEFYRLALEIDPDHENAGDNLYELESEDYEDYEDYEDDEMFEDSIQDSYDDDFELFHSIQQKIYLKGRNRIKFKSQVEEDEINRHILNAWTKRVAGEIHLAESLNEDQKVEWYNSIEIDFSGEPAEAEMPVINDPLHKEFAAIFSFLPPNGLSFLMIAFPYLRAVGISENYIASISKTNEISSEDKDKFIWAHEIGEKIFKLSESKSEKAFIKKTDEIISIAAQRLSRDKAEKIFIKLIEGMTGR
jgi:tetratricopeptide (TPR) repeat protein